MMPVRSVIVRAQRPASCIDEEEGLEPKPHAGGAPRRMRDAEDRLVISFLTLHPQATVGELGIHADTAVKLGRVRTIEAASSRASRPRLYVFLHRP
jgi:hypothetical protein